MFKWCAAVWQITAFKKRRSSSSSSSSESAQTLRSHSDILRDNPYFQSRLLWNDCYGTLQTKLENSYRIIFILSLVIVSTVVGMLIIAGKTRIQPFPFIIHGNEVITAADAPVVKMRTLRPQLAIYFAKQFIRAARGVSVDGAVNAEHEMTAFSLVRGAAVPVLKSFYQQHPPNHIAREKIKQTAITSLLRRSPQSFVIRWREDCRDVHSGLLLATHHYISELTYRYDSPSTHAIILRHNPLGFYITHLSWSDDSNHESNHFVEGKNQ